MRVALVSSNRELLPSPVVPLGLLSVAAALREEHDVEVVDLCFEDAPLERLRSALAAFHPDVVGLGLRNLHTSAYDNAEGVLAEHEAVAATIRAVTQAPLVLGGAGFSLRPDLLLSRLAADHGVVGEGERAFPALLRTMRAGARPARLVRGEPADLDRLRPAARVLGDPRYFAFDGTANLQGKRGCGFRCAYCDYPDLEGRRVRLRGPAAIADELVALSQTGGVTHGFFVDSVFNVPRGHALAVCAAIAERGAPLPWVCYASPVALDDTMVAAMARAGCVGAEIGTDAGTDEMLARLDKPFRLDAVRAARKAFVDHGVLDCHTFVLGAEGETAADAAQTLRFVEELDPDVAVFIVFMEDRESKTVGRAVHREALLRLLAERAPRRPGWVVPELGIRFGRKVTAVVRRERLRGPAWLHLARLRRQSRIARAG